MASRRFHLGLLVFSFLSLSLTLILTSRTILAKSQGKKITILYTNDTWGVLEPCGCGGRNTGGLSRRATYIKSVQAESPNCIIVESGNLAFPVDASKPAAQLEAVANCLKAIGYCAVGVGAIDAKLGYKYYETLMARGIPVVHEDQSEHDGAKPYLSRDINGVKIGIVSFGYTLPEKDSPDLRKAQYDAYREVRKKSDVLILLDQANIATDEWLSANGSTLGSPDIVVGGSSRSTLSAPKFIGRTMVVPTSSQGTYVGRVDIEIDKDKREMTFSRTLIDPRISSDPDIQKIVKDYEKSQKVTTENTLPSSSKTTLSYQSYQTCIPCHKAEYVQWSQTRHGKALSTLLDAEKAIPDCLPCHSDAYKRVKRITVAKNKIGGVECIACHADVLPHGVSYKKKNDTSIIQSKCQECHTKERSPNFNLDLYYEKVKHTK